MRLKSTLPHKPLPPLPNYTAALAAMRAGIRNARVMIMGDSYSQGTNSDPSNTNSYGSNYTTQLANKLNANGTPADSQGACSFIYATFNSQGTQDLRMTMNGGWNGDSSFLSLGGPVCSASTTGTLAITPGMSVDTIIIYYVQYAASANSFSWNINGGSNTTVNAQGTDSIQKLVIPCTLGTNTVNLKWVSGTCHVCGWEAYNSAVKRVHFINCGISGYTTAKWIDTTNGYSSGYGMAAIAPDLVILELGLNDMNGAVAVATYAANMQTAINTARSLNADIILVTGGPWDPVNGTAYPGQEPFIHTQRLLAAQNNLRIVDMYRRWGNLALATAQGYEASGAYNIDCHPSAKGQLDYMLSIYNTMGRM